MGVLGGLVVGIAVGLGVRSPPAPTRPEVRKGQPRQVTSTLRTIGAGSPALPMWANDRLVPVWTASGEPRYLDASQAPLLLFAATDPASVRGLLTRIGNRPVQLVAAAFPTASLTVAESLLERLEAGALAGRTVYALQGSFMPYTKTLPALVYQDVWASRGKTVGIGRLGRAELRAIYARTLAGVGTQGG
jgi:hypothetical protein